MKTSEKIELLDTVEVLQDIPSSPIRAGMIGTVLDFLSSKALLVEFVDEDGDDNFVYCFKPEELRLSTPYTEMQYSSHDSYEYREYRSMKASPQSKIPMTTALPTAPCR